MPFRSAGLVLFGLLSLAVPSRAGDLLLSSEVVASGLTLPVYATAPAGDERLFVLEQNTGRIQLVKAGEVQPTPFLDLSAQLLSGGERGLLCLAFHPAYDVNGRFYVTSNVLNGDLVLQRFLVDPLDPDRGLLASAETLLALPQPFPQHNGSMIAFGPTDGLLYMSTGDGGSFNDPFDNAQDLTSLLGKLLRLDVDGPFPYGIPAANPFVTEPGARDEIFAYGLRNPWRFSLDARNGAVFIGDVGQGGREEVDLIRPNSPGGQNFGWRCAEGTLCTELGACACPEPQLVDPIYEFDHNEGCSIIGGYVYRGSDIPELQGTYFFGDYCTSRVWSFTVEAGVAVEVQERTLELSPPGGSLGFITSFGRDGRGELLIVGYLGEIRRVTPAPLVADCDGDGISDADELAAGNAFDVNANGVPDECEQLLTGTTFVEGQPAQLDLIGAQPRQPLAWFVSLRGIGPGPCFLGGSICMDLKPFNVGGPAPDLLLLAITLADASGAASLPFIVPPGIPSAAFQVLLANGQNSSKSNPIQKLVQGP
ncbi:MAG: sugar dehydrogenase [Planctomycetota bacterium]|nr:MAG: sugar dehydrogenase [Planctomycetota bacterium]